MKKRTVTAILFFAVTLLALGCSGSGNRAGMAGHPFDTTHVYDIQPGMDKQQIRQWFGEPYTISKSQKTFEDGRQIDTEVWVYVHSIGNPGRKNRAQSLAVIFDPDGKVLSSGFSDGAE